MILVIRESGLAPPNRYADDGAGPQVWRSREYDSHVAQPVRRFGNQRSRSFKALEAENPQMERIIARQTLGGFADCAVVSASNGCDVVHLTASQ